MNLADITTKCYILALIIRDDGERLLLGDGAYEFKDSQQHFIANTYANDVVELQGTDGQMLAGQVRRTATQTFAGYIGDATFSKQKVEEARRDFLMFFRKKHYYTAVYVFSDGTAIQRDRGYIVNAPSVPELYQRFPEWSVGLNFEDPNYYEYAEDDLGQEIAAHKVELELSTAMSGGLIWDGDGAVSDDLSYVGTEIPGEGKNFQLADTGTATLKSAELLGDAEQTTYSGKNKLASTASFSETHNGITFTGDGAGKYTVSGTATAGSNSAQMTVADYTIQSGDYLHIMNSQASTTCAFVLVFSDATTASPTITPANKIWSLASYVGKTVTKIHLYASGSTVISTPITLTPMIVNSATATDFEPYVGGTASPNPDYPQAVNTVTGEQTVKIEGKNLLDTAKFTSSANIATIDTQESVLNISQNSDLAFVTIFDSMALPSGTYTIWCEVLSGTYTGGNLCYFDSSNSKYSQEFNFRTSTTHVNTLNATNGLNQLKIYAPKADNDVKLKIWIVNGTYTASNFPAYEPYQAQTLPVNLGKNLFDGIIEQGGFDGSGLNVGVGNRVRSTNYIPVQPNTKYTIKGFSWDTTKGAVLGASISYYSVNDYTTARLSYQNWVSIGVEQGFTLTTPANCHYIRFLLTVGATAGGTTAVTPADIGEVQVELGSQATTYASYFAPIELAKIGNYQDRIYKDSGKWYIEKQVGKVAININGYNSNYTNVDYAILDKPTDALNYGTYSVMSALCESAVSPETTGGYNQTAQIGRLCSQADKTHLWIGVTKGTTQATAKTMLDGKSVYYALATPTTTEITNNELVGQLERLQHAHTYADTTNFSITATSPNLPAFLKVVAFGDDAIPQGGYVWEDGGAGGATTITVDGVDNAQPIWTVVGPATNPSLTNITTGESIQWTGVVPNGQTLVVNMADMTASLSGANVFEFISGSWITLQAGNNRVSYSATAATGIATLEWNGVVG